MQNLYGAHPMSVPGLAMSVLIHAQWLVTPPTSKRNDLGMNTADWSECIVLCEVLDKSVEITLDFYFHLNGKIEIALCS